MNIFTHMLISIKNPPSSVNFAQLNRKKNESVGFIFTNQISTAIVIALQVIASLIVSPLSTYKNLLFRYSLLVVPLLFERKKHRKQIVSFDLLK